MEPVLFWPQKAKQLFPPQAVVEETLHWSKADPNHNNLLLHGDNYPLLFWLKERKYKVDLVYMDPPFNTGNTFFCRLKTKKGTINLETLGYQDNWRQSLNNYLEMLFKRLAVTKEIMRDDASLYVHLDWRVVHYVKVILDELFGRENFRNEIIWWYHDPSGTTKRTFMRKHDTILFYSKSSKHKFNLDEIREPYAPRTLFQGKRGDVSFGRKTTLHPLGKPPEDVWEIPIINSQAHERLGYPTQKPLKLMERIIRASSNPGDIVLDPFCGSGTTMEAAARTGRRWIGIDNNNYGLYLAKKRLFSFSPRINIWAGREQNSCRKQGRKWVQECYKRALPTLDRWREGETLILISPGEEDWYELENISREVKSIHVWDLDFPWLLVNKLEEKIAAADKEILLFPLYDNARLPLFTAKIKWKREKGVIIINIDELTQGYREDTPLSEIHAHELIDFMLVDNGNQQVYHSPVILPLVYELPKTFSNSEKIVVRIHDILGRYRDWVKQF